MRSLTFTQVWLEPGLWFLGASQVLDAPRLPDTFSISYGECERVIRGSHAQPDERAGADLLDSLLARLGLVGVAAHASLFPAWPVVLAGRWVTDGGTRAARPLIAGGFAVLSAR